jgi:hypothetical protein
MGFDAMTRHPQMHRPSSIFLVEIEQKSIGSYRLAFV